MSALEFWQLSALLPRARVTLPADGDTMARVASFLGYSGNYAAARVLQQIANSRGRVLGAEHSDTLNARDSR